MLRMEPMRTRALLEQPESGMGYQIVEVVTADFKTKRGVVYNAELLLFEEEPRTMLKTASFASLLAESKSSQDEIRSLRVLPRTTASQLVEAVREPAASYGRKTGPAKDTLPEQTKEGEVFKRFSFFADDRRILPDGSLRLGTYGTTEKDAQNVRTGKEAVARYALPDPRPASNRFTIEPHKDTVVQCGVVEPAFDQPGGGIEVLFANGTQPKTVTGRDKIRDE
ncbi:MAG: hypothetical protein WCV00_09380 [Verrucomicrobiia bacterium]|jgi:hypothetical protein